MSELRFGKEKRHIDWELLRKIGVWLLQITLVCGIAFICVWYFGQRASTIGESMEPILKNGDVVLVNTIIYDASSPKRGDIIAFKPNGNENTHYYIKRIIGLPGEKLEIKQGKIYINGKKLKETYKTTKIKDVGIAEGEVVLKGDEYFVLGDNRLSSEDSRMADVGNVKKSEIKGKAWFVAAPRKSFGFIRK
ncbi:MAG: signal peptidase I [Lachnospiraceae bacterium]